MRRHRVWVAILFLVVMAWPLAASASVLAPAGIPSGDCNDTNTSVYPGHVEVVGDFLDNDCDGLGDEDANDNPSSDTVDHDGDGISLNAGDCNDTQTSAAPNSAEIAGNLIDDDCDGLADEAIDDTPSNDAADHDEDGYTIGPDLIFRSGFDSIIPD
jgi:hypothetical protein